MLPNVIIPKSGVFFFTYIKDRASVNKSSALGPLVQ